MTSLKVAQEFFFFLKEVISCYNVLQQVTMHCKRLQKQYSPRTSLKVLQKFFFSKEEKNKKTARKIQRKKFYGNVTLYSASAINILDFP